MLTTQALMSWEVTSQRISRLPNRELKTKKTDPDHSNTTGQYELNTAFRFADIARMIPYNS